MAGREATLGWLLLFQGHVVRTIVYVDGFNLYFGALRKTPHRWLNLHTLASLLLPKHTINENPSS